MRTNYDKIADTYDCNSFRNKSVDKNLIDFIETYKKPLDSLNILDLGCGTGNQLVANKKKFPQVKMTGLDKFNGMLNVARKKSSDITWVRGSSDRTDFSHEEFDYITSQFSYHHMPNKKLFAKEVSRIIKKSGWFVVSNIDVFQMKDWVIYRFFPEAWAIDQEDFLELNELETLFENEGFSRVQLNQNRIDLKMTIRKLFESVKRRDSVSQLQAISDKSFENGVKNLKDFMEKNNSLEWLEPIVVFNLILKKNI